MYPEDHWEIELSQEVCESVGSLSVVCRKSVLRIPHMCTAVFQRCTDATGIRKIHSKASLSLSSVSLCAFSMNSCIKYNSSHTEPLDILTESLCLKVKDLEYSNLEQRSYGMSRWHLERLLIVQARE